MLLRAHGVRLVLPRQQLGADGARLLGCQLGIVGQVLQHDHEFVAAQARHGIAFPHAADEASRSLLQQHVAHVMA